MTRALALLLLVVGGIATAVLAVEATVRLAVPVSDFFWQSDPLVGVGLIPHKRGHFVKRGTFNTPVAINSRGFRDREHPPEPSAGTRRIVVLGDSFVEALQVPFERSVTPLLEARLQDVGIRAETINLGVSGFGTGREYLMLRGRGLTYQPDLVLLFFVGNDVSDNSARLQGLPYVPYPIPAGDGAVARDAGGQPRFTAFTNPSSRLGGLARFLRDHSQGYRLLREAIDASPAVHRLLYRVGLMSTPPEPVAVAQGSLGFYEIYRPDHSAAWTEAWALTDSLLLATRDLAETHGARFAVVLVPAAWDVDPSAWQRVLAKLPPEAAPELNVDRPSRRLIAFLETHDIQYVNLLPGFRARAARVPPLYFAEDGHWTEAGHRLAVDLLVDPVATLVRARPATSHSVDRDRQPRRAS